MSRMIGLDIGATKTLGVLVDAEGRVLAQALEATEPGSDGVIATAARVVEDLGGDGAAVSVGVGIPGLVDHVTGEVQHAVNLGLNGDRLELRALLQDRCALPVHVENDVNAATLGAVVLSGIRDLVYLSIGTGLAAGIAMDGVVRRGATGAAGEIGHVPVDPAGALCPCGQRGCLETVASGSAIAAAWPSGDTPAAQALFAAAASGDAEAIVVRDRFAAGVADAVRTLALSVDPQTVVIGGGVSHLGEELLDCVADALRHQASQSPFLAALDLAARLRVVPQGHPVAAVGAALLGRS